MCDDVSTDTGKIFRQCFGKFLNCYLKQMKLYWTSSQRRTQSSKYFDEGKNQILIASTLTYFGNSQPFLFHIDLILFLLIKILWRFQF